MFAYSSVESYGIITPQGKKLKETHVKLKNGMGIKTVIVGDEHGIHEDTMTLTNEEMKNIKNRTFMPKLFHRSMKNIKAKKSKSKKTKTKAKSRKSRKAKGFFNGLF